MGLLPVLVLFLALVLSALGIHHAYLSSHLTLDLASFDRDRAAARIARSILEEAHAVLQRQALDLASPVGQAVTRRELGPASLQLELSELPASKRLLDADRNFRIAGGKVEVAMQLAAFEGIPGTERPYERRGTVSLAVTVEPVPELAPAGARFLQAHRARKTLAFRVLSLAPPRPLDRFTVALANPDQLINGEYLRLVAPDTTDANIVIQDLLVDILRLKEDMPDDLDTKLASFQGLLEITEDPRAASSIQQQMSEIRELKRYVLEPFPVEQIQIAWSPVPVERQVHLFRWPLLMFTRDRDVDLARLDIATRIRQDAAGFVQLRDAFRQERSVIGDGVQETRRAVAAVKAYFDLVKKLTVHFKDFQDALTERGGREQAAFQPALERALALDAWLSPSAGVTATAKAPEEPGDPLVLAGALRRSPKTDLRIAGADLARRVAGAEPLSGVVLVEGPATLSGTVRGQVVLVCPDDLVLDGVRAPGQLTVVTEGRTTVRGEVEAALLARGPVDLTQGRLTGALVLDDLAFAGGQSERTLTGRVTADPRIATGAGPLPRQLRVLLSPVVLESAVSRVPEE